MRPQRHLTKYSFGGLFLMFTWHGLVPGGSSPYSLSDTSVVLCYKSNPLCPQLISARAIIFLWRLHETGSDIEVHGLWAWSSIDIYSRLSSCPPNNLHVQRPFSRPSHFQSCFGYVPTYDERKYLSVKCWNSQCISMCIFIHSDVWCWNIKSVLKIKKKENWKHCSDLFYCCLHWNRCLIYYNN